MALGVQSVRLSGDLKQGASQNLPKIERFRNGPAEVAEPLAQTFQEQ